MLLRQAEFVMVVALNENEDVLGRIYGHVLHRFEATDLLLYEVDVALSVDPPDIALPGPRHRLEAVGDDWQWEDTVT